MKDGGSAFPIQGQRFTLGETTYEPSCPGMTLRDYFAAKAMQAIISGSMAYGKTLDARSGAITVTASYSISDAMLAEREK